MKKFRDDLTEQSFKNKLKRFENLSAQQEDNSPLMSPPPTSPNLSKFSYLNYVGEKLFTRDTNTTRLSMDETQLNAGETPKNLLSPNGDVEQRRPKPELKPKPQPGYGKPKPRMDSSARPLIVERGGSSGGGRSEFKTLSMISTETSIWGSTSSAGTVRLDDELSTPASCNTPIEDLLDHPDVFSDEMTSSLTMKHQQMVRDLQNTN